MNKKVWLSLFFIILLLELLCILLQYNDARYATKPLLVLLLIGYMLSQLKSITAPLKVSAVIALSFSWLGDVLLLFESRAALFFILGLSSFLIAHLFYIYLFHSMRLQERITIKPFLFAPVALFYAALLGLLHPHLGVMKLPVYVYGLVICTMLFAALHLSKIRVNNIGNFIVTGAILFIISDAALAINKFYFSFNGAGIIIMLTYGLAQFCITEGCVRWLPTTAAQRTKPVVSVS